MCKLRIQKQIDTVSPQTDKIAWKICRNNVLYSCSKWLLSCYDTHEAVKDCAPQIYEFDNTSFKNTIPLKQT